MAAYSSKGRIVGFRGDSGKAHGLLETEYAPRLIIT
jgi:hypothetical protein